MASCWMSGGPDVGSKRSALPTARKRAPGWRSGAEGIGCESPGRG